MLPTEPLLLLPGAAGRWALARPDHLPHRRAQLGRARHPDDPLLRHPRTLITPHTAALTGATYTRMCLRVVEATLAVLAGREPEAACVFNRDRL